MLNLEAAKKLCAAATEGPWEFEDDGTIGGIIVRPPRGRPHRHDSVADAEFIAASRTLVPELIVEVERLKRGLEDLGKVFADRNESLREEKRAMRAVVDLARAWAATFCVDCQDDADDAESRLLAAIRELP